MNRVVRIENKLVERIGQVKQLTADEKDAKKLVGTIKAFDRYKRVALAELCSGNMSGKEYGEMKGRLNTHSKNFITAIRESGTYKITLDEHDLKTLSSAHSPDVIKQADNTLKNRIAKALETFVVFSEAFAIKLMSTKIVLVELPLERADITKGIFTEISKAE